MTDYTLTGEISAESVAALVAHLAAHPGPVTLRIHSEGGDVTAALEGSHAIAKHGAVTAIVAGQAASAATLILASAQTAVATESALLMTHAPWSVTAGNAADLRAQADALERADAAMRTVYGRRVADVDALFGDADRWLSATEAQSLGLVDRVEPVGSAQARANGAPKGQAPLPVRTRYVARETPRTLAASALLARMGKQDAAAKRHNDGNPYSGASLAALSDPSMRAAGSGFAVGIDDFPNVLSETANRAVGVTFMEHPEAWRTVCESRQVPDFRDVTLASMGAIPSLPSVGEHTEFERVNPDDSGEKTRLGTFAGTFAVSRRAIVNDDLMALSDTAEALGRSASRAIGDQFANLLTQASLAGPTLSDGTAMVASARGNAGTAALSSAAMDASYSSFAKLTDPSGVVIGAMPTWALVPVALRGSMSAVLTSEHDVSSDFAGDSTAANRAMGLISPTNIVQEYRIDAVSVTAWWLIGMGQFVVLSREAGGPMPMVMPFELSRNRDCYDAVCRIDAVVAPTGGYRIVRGNT